VVKHYSRGVTTGRYDRQARLAGFGEAALRRLRQASVLVVGAGGLGSPVLAYLAGAGVGRLRIVDDDVVELANLPRQVLYGEADVGGLKATAAAARVRALNADVAVEALAERFTGTTAPALLAGVVVAVDCSDNLATRHALNRACLRAGVPAVWAAIGGWCGRCSVTLPSAGPCFECVVGPPVTTPAPARAPVFGPVCGATGALAAAEAVKLMTGAGQPLVGRLANLDARTGELTTIALARDPRCQACGPGRSDG